MYDRTVNDKTLTFCVSGQLWNRSLIMMDVETETLWSHLLGESVHGQLHKSQLRTIPSDMLTWSAWKQRYPNTSVLNLSRTHRDYSAEFYRDPNKFVVGFVGNYGVQHCSLATLLTQPILNADARGLPLLICFDSDSTSAQVFERRVDDTVLVFQTREDGRLVDDHSGSVWDAATGTAVEGSWKGKRLTPHVGIVSFTRAWLTFHPDSKQITVAAKAPVD